MQAFPGLTSQQVVDLLLNTADDTGAPGTDGLNGRGRLNIGRAFQPVGQSSRADLPQFRANFAINASRRDRARIR